jgi:hypothetical protein
MLDKEHGQRTVSVPPLPSLKGEGWGEGCGQHSTCYAVRLSVPLFCLHLRANENANSKASLQWSCTLVCCRTDERIRARWAHTRLFCSTLTLTLSLQGRERGPENSLVLLLLFTYHVSHKHLFWKGVGLLTLRNPQSEIRNPKFPSGLIQRIDKATVVDLSQVVVVP